MTSGDGPDDQTFRGAALACLDGLFGFAMALTRDRMAAEDLVQDTYLRALAARRRAEPGEHLRGWLFTILHNAWRNQVRKPRLAALDDTDRARTVLWLAAPPDPEEELRRTRLREAVWQAIAAVPEPFREVVVLRCFEGFSYQEIASILDCPTGTVMSRLARGRALVRQALGPAARREPREARR
jgi:RNA polymerase sigma-70 factor (ECF subfamily)